MSGSHTGVQTFEVGAFRWRAGHPWGEALREGLAPWLEDPARSPLRTLKDARRRQVYQAVLPGLPPLVLKRYPPRTGFPESLRDLAATRAQVEFERTEQLVAAGLSCPQPLAWAVGEGPARRRESWLVSQGILGAAALGPYLEDRHQPGDRSPTKLALVRRALELARRLHDAGFVHRDFHGGNLLLRPAEGPGGVLYLIDCARAWWLGVVPDGWRARELAHLFHTLRHVLDRDETRGLQAEVAQAGPGRDLLEQALRRAERRGDRSRTGRALAPCSRYRHERLERGPVIRDQSLPLEALARLLEAHERAVREGSTALLRLGTRSRLSVAEDPATGPVVVKEYPGGASRARRAWVGGVALRARDVPTPAPLALVTGPGDDGVLVLGHAGDAAPLHFLTSRTPGPDPERLLGALGDLVIHLFTRGPVHGDLSPKNLLWNPDQPDAPVQLVDWDAVRPRAQWTVRRRLRALAQLSDLPGVELPDQHWRRFLQRVAEATAPHQDHATWEAAWRLLRRRRQRKHAERRT